MLSLFGADTQRLVALCEQGARGASHALFLVLGEPSPEVSLTRAEPIALGDVTGHLGAPDERFVCVAFGISGGVRGALLLVVEEQEAALLVERLVPSEAENLRHGRFDERAQGAFTEVGNIVASAFLNEIATRLRTSCLPSVPSFLLGGVRAGLDEAIALDTTGGGGDPTRPALLVRAELERGGFRARLHLVVLPAAESIAALVGATHARRSL